MRCYSAVIGLVLIASSCNSTSSFASAAEGGGIAKTPEEFATALFESFVKNDKSIFDKNVTRDLQVIIPFMREAIAASPLKIDREQPSDAKLTERMKSNYIDTVLDYDWKSVRDQPNNDQIAWNEAKITKIESSKSRLQVPNRERIDVAVYFSAGKRSWRLDVGYLTNLGPGWYVQSYVIFPDYSKRRSR